MERANQQMFTFWPPCVEISQLVSDFFSDESALDRTLIFTNTRVRVWKAEREKSLRAGKTKPILLRKIELDENQRKKVSKRFHVADF